jgi:5,10-methylenetetrahydromethanopterin reductase
MDWRWTDSLGLALMGPGVPARTTEWARAAEHAGLGSLWVIEDYFHPGAYALAGAAAAVTERLTIGLGVVNPYTRHPALVAMETAALAGIAPGRIVLGLGSSNRKWVEAQMAIPFKTPLRALREGVDIVRRLLDGQRVTCAGDVLSVHDVVLERPPADRVPILLGVKGSRALGLAAEIGDGVVGSILTSPAHVRRIRALTARAPAPFTVVAYVPIAVADDAAAARAWMRPLVAHYLGLLHGQSILEDAGIPAARTQAFHEAFVAGRAAGDLVSDALLDAVAIAGSPRQCRTALERWAEAGLDGAIAVVPAGADLAEQIERLGALSPAWKALRCR